MFYFIKEDLVHRHGTFNRLKLNKEPENIPNSISSYF